ncbi:MAG: cellulose biosynthesis (CelD)-like protein, partial [Solirubrobacterales bacterium]|nr:cellulose biosynthesis (CelD)-like protein [Solirubrobacterales bacterium]
ADAGSAAADLEAFVRLHVGRWEGRGGSGVLSPEVTAFVRAVGPELVSAGRLRIWSFDLDGEVVATGLLLHAGEEVGYWLGGFDTEHGKLELSKLVMLEVIRDGHRLGTRKVDLGEGDFAYKRRFTEDEEELVRVLVVLPSRRGVQAAAGVAPALARTWVATHLSPEHKGRARDLLARAKAVRP